jgi:hypothetical protein
MRKSAFAVIIMVFALTFSCDSIEGTFDDSVPNFYSLTTNVSPQEGGTVQPSSGEFLEGNSVQIVARPAEGYVFDHWEGDLSGSSNPALLQFNSNRTVTAHFSLRDYNLNIEITGSGVVNETVLERSSSVTIVSLSAEAEEGWFFDRWEDDLSGNSNPDTLTIEGDEEKSVTAIFLEELAEYSLNVTIEGEGTVNRDPDQSSYTEGDEVTLTAEAASGWSFKEWDGDLSGSTNPVTITMDEEKSITAIFEEDEPEEYTLTIDTEGLGSVEKNPDRSIYIDGDEVTLTANAALGWVFKEWQGDLSGSANPETILIDDDKQVTAIFEIDLDFGITINEVKLFIKEMELGGARRTRDFKTKEFILSLPPDGSPFQVTHVPIPAGFYDELKLDIAKLSSSADIDDPDFRDGSKRYSLVVNGVFNGIDFTFQSDEDFKIDVDLSPHLEIKSGQKSVIAINVDFEAWFKGKDSIYLDPNDPKNTKQINKNIEDSFSDFEDDS